VPLSAPLSDETAAASTAVLNDLREAGGTPWLSLIFRTPAPLAQNSDRLQSELRAAAALAGQTPKGTWFQVVWRPEGSEDDEFNPAEYGFLLKRAAVALTGAKADVLVATQGLTTDVQAIEALYGQEIAAYIEAVALEPGMEGAHERAIEAIQRLDPGRPIVLDSLPLPADPGDVLAEAAHHAARGVDLTLFNTPSIPLPSLYPFVVLARELKGDLSYDASAAPTGTPDAWVFVRGEDLALRVIARAPEGAGELVLDFRDPGLRRPTRFP
jgi:hypothetical protein